MACYHPVTAWQTDDGNIVFAERGRIKNQITLSCGQCKGCRLERSRQWAVRCMHEAQMHQHNCFVTLTYETEHLPENNQLVYEHFQRFMKRLRKKALGKRDNRESSILTDEPQLQNTDMGLRPIPPQIRFYMAGEYGEQRGRPHFHTCLFGIDFGDKKYHSTTQAKSKIYTSKTLQKIWTSGFSSIGEMNFQSAAYTARYIMKKINGDKAEKHYTRINTETGEIYKQQQEMNNMSRKPGLGSSWIKKFQTDVYPEGKVIIRGKKYSAPRYYNKQYKAMPNNEYEVLEYTRYLETIKHASDNTDARLQTREIVADAKLQLLKRTI